MLNQKDNDFDDLFRRASDKYPLRTDSADWDRMAAALDDPSSALPDMQDTDKRRKRRFIWFFLLLPLGGAGYYAWHQAGIGHGHAVVTESVVKAPASGSGASDLGTSSTGSGAGDAGNRAGTGAGAGDAGGNVAGTGAGGVVASDAGKGSGAANGGGSGAVGAGTVAGGPGAGDAGTGANGAGTGAGAVGSGKNGVGGGATVRSGRGKNGKNGFGGIKDAASGGVVGGATSGAVGVSKDGEVGGDATNGMIGGGRTVGNGKGAEKGAEASRVANYPVNRAPISKNYNLTVNVVAPVVTKDSSKVKPKASSKQKSSYLYAGLLAAPDLSTVKFQSMKGVGTTYSLLLGYQFNKRWAVETGVSLDRKRYYTSGEYFDTKGVHLPTWGYTLKDVDGTCYMWEIPINVRYNFSQSEKTKWFATAGLSTYFMTREKYNYSGIYNGNPSDSSWNIKKPSQYWFSIINLSVGYEHRLGGIGNLRIEPYLRVPLSGLGTGKLNILSTGINIGITRRLW
jgi:hypothetical protein